MATLSIAFVTALTWCVASLWLGPRLGFVDRPDAGLKTHRGPAVPLGGVGVFLGFHAGAVTADLFSPGLGIASGLVLGLGLIDDRVGLPVGLRLVAEGLAGVLLVLLVETPLGSSPFGVVLGAVMVIVAANAVNLVDGLDGLAGTSALVSALGLAALAQYGAGSPLPGLALSAALLGFIVLNWAPAKVFLGDNGAYVTGVFLVYLMLRAEPASTGALGLLVGPAMLGFFLIDLVVTLIRRAAGAAPIFVGDRAHVYDRLHARGWSVGTVSGGIGLFQVVWVGTVLALSLADIGGWIVFPLTALLGLTVTALWRLGLAF